MCIKNISLIRGNIPKDIVHELLIFYFSLTFTQLKNTVTGISLYDAAVIPTLPPLRPKLVTSILRKRFPLMRTSSAFSPHVIPIS